MTRDGAQGSSTIKKMLTGSMLAFSLILLMLGLGTLVDGYVIGTYLGVDNMAAYGLVSPLISLFNAFGTLFYIGAESLVAKQMGLGNAKRANQFLSLTLMAEVVFSAIFIAFSLIFSTQFAMLLGATGDSAYLIDYVRDYLLGFVPGLPAYMLMLTLGVLVQLDGGQKRAIISVVAMLVAETAGDFIAVLVFGTDIFGIALANTIGYYLAAGILFMHFVRKNHALRFSLRNMHLPDLRPLLAHGAPSAAGSIGYALQNVLINYILLAFASGVAVAAFGVEGTLLNILTIIEYAAGGATLLLTSLMLGEESRDGLRNTLRLSLKYVFLAQLCAGILAFVFAVPLVELFSSSADEVIAPAADCIRFLAISLPISGLNGIFANYLQGIHRVKGAAVAIACRSFFFIVILSYLLGSQFGALGVWIAIPLSELATLAALVIAAAVYSQHAPRSIDDYLFLPRDFGVPDRDKLEDSITGIAQVSDFTERAFDFCMAHGADRRTANTLAHCVEETAVNIICSGFTDGKPHRIDLRVVAKNGSFIIRVRDDCPELDPEKQLRQHDPSQLADDLSVRMLYAMAKDVQYTYALNFNNTLIKV